ncbi:MAG: LacI family DNA-binding transcriptional regulator [Anaerolineales bacterium]
MRKQRKPSPKMVDVAKLAGVSQTTVSFVINGNPEIPDETKERVRAAIAELGYRPNLAAKSLRSKRSGIIGFVTDEIAITPYAGKIFEGAQDVAWEQAKILLLVNTKNDAKLQATAIEMLIDRRVEGLIFATMFHRLVTPPAILWQIPSVLLDCFVADRSLASVVPDEIGGAFKATSVLLQKGHRRVGFANNQDPIPATDLRLEGYKAALSACGISFDPALVATDDSSSDGGYRCAQKLMKEPDPPTALFCFNDRMAMGVYDCLRKLNLSIPGDVAVLGFDNQEMISAHLYPPLSTMELPHYEMGKWATSYLLEHLDHEDGLNPIQHKTECPFIQRASV